MRYWQWHSIYSDRDRNLPRHFPLHAYLATGLQAADTWPCTDLESCSSINSRQACNRHCQLPCEFWAKQLAQADCSSVPWDLTRAFPHSFGTSHSRDSQKPLPPGCRFRAATLPPISGQVSHTKVLNPLKIFYRMSKVTAKFREEAMLEKVLFSSCVIIFVHLKFQNI